MNEEIYTAEEVADRTHCDAHTLRSQVKSDIAQGRNKQNWNARQVGNKLIFSKADIDQWLKGRGVGPVFVVPESPANLGIRLGMAVEVQDGSENV